MSSSAIVAVPASSTPSAKLLSSCPERRILMTPRDRYPLVSLLAVAVTAALAGARSSPRSGNGRRARLGIVDRVEVGSGSGGVHAA